MFWVGQRFERNSILDTRQIQLKALHLKISRRKRKGFDTFDDNFFMIATGMEDSHRFTFVAFIN